MINNGQEYILCAAIHFPDMELQEPEVLELRGFRPYNITKGIVISGWRHANCFHQVSAIGVEWNTDIQGFLTSKNRFVDRKEGGLIAFNCGQIERQTDCLFSEDLY